MHYLVYSLMNADSIFACRSRWSNFVSQWDAMSSDFSEILVLACYVFAHQKTCFDHQSFLYHEMSNLNLLGASS
jgi:hypothetical protein